MTQKSTRPDGASRRKFILSAGALGATALAGCSGGGDTTEAEDETDDPGQETVDQNESTPESESNSGDISPLTADGSSTVYPITSQAGSLWNGNAPADDEEYWGPDQYDIDTDKNMADYWAGLYGFEPSGEEGTPPFYTSIGLNHTGVGLEKLENGQVDIGDASAPVSAEF
ncbi:MAG: phosphate ABC transporter substrate-binding protein, partial [Halorhabdus sp.]